YGLAVYYIIFELFGLSRLLEGMDQWSTGSIIVFFALPVFFYTLVFESFMEGQTIGKHVLKIKVIKIDGYQAGFGDYLIRWLFRLIDININMGIIGLIAMLLSKKTQRLGDMSAGTAVITLKSNVTINHTILKELKEDYVPTYPMVIRLS